MPENKQNQILTVLMYIFFGGALAFIFLKYLLPPLLPFILAYITAMFLRPSILRISNRTGLPKKAVSVICVSFVFAIVFCLITIFFGRVIAELKDICLTLMDDAPSIIEEIFTFGERLPIFSGIKNRDVALRLEGALTKGVENMLSSLCSRLPDAVISLASALPAILLFIITLVVSTFYFGSDVGYFNTFIASKFSGEKRQKLFDVKKRLMSAAMKYGRAYLIILIMTFFQLLIGFWILKIPYALTLASVIALIDILPVLGVGTVLVPWAVVLLIMGDKYTAIGLLIIFGVIWLIRQITEPKIVGQSVGVHPLITLVAMYGGYMLMGFGGIFLFPIVAAVVQNVLDALRAERSTDK